MNGCYGLLVSIALCCQYYVVCGLRSLKRSSASTSRILTQGFHVDNDFFSLNKKKTKKKKNRSYPNISRGCLVTRLTASARDGRGGDRWCPSPLISPPLSPSVPPQTLDGTYLLLLPPLLGLVLPSHFNLSLDTNRGWIR